MTVSIPAELLDVSRLGAERSFESIYRSLAGNVRRFLAAQGAADPDATTQEVFVKVLRSHDRFVGDSEHLRSWVFTVARNLLIDERRAMSRRPVTVSGLVPDPVSPNGEDDVVAGLDAIAVRAILDGLPDDQREVVVLRFLVDLPLGDVATIIGRSRPAVKALQHRGLTRLRRQLESLVCRAESFSAPQTFTEV